MRKNINKVLAIFLSFLMILNTGVVFAATVSEGENGKTIYISTTFSSDKNGESAIESVDEGETFYIWVNFFNNPIDLEDTAQAYSFCIGYDDEKIEIVKKGNQLTSPTFNKDFAKGVVFATAGFTDGVLDEDENIVSEGALFRIEAKALETISSDVLNGIKFLPSATGKETQDTKILDGARNKFNLIQLPDLAVDDYDGYIYSDTTADEIKDMIAGFSVIDRVGELTTYTKSDSQWDDFEIILPAEGLVVGENTITASYGDMTSDYTINVLDRVESIAITKAPTRTEYTAFETFDRTGMEVTATYESGETKVVTEDCIVDTTTELKVSDTEWTVTYGELSITQEITVNPAEITEGLTLGQQKYTVTYSELPTKADVTGVKSETVNADISWYADADCTNPASGEIASIDDVGDTVTLYYKATGMTNYEDYKGAVDVVIIDKTPATITWKTLPAGFTLDGKKATVTYDENGYVLTADLFSVKAESGSNLGTAKAIIVANSSDEEVDKITDAGTYTVTVEYEDKDNKGKEEFTVVVNPKSIAGFKVSLKVGDGEAFETSESNPLLTTYTGSTIAPVVTAVAGVPANGFESAVVAANKNVSDMAYTIAVNGIGNYTGTTYGYWNITPAEISVSDATVENKTYNGKTDDAKVTGVEFDGLKGEDEFELDVDYEIVSAVYADKNAAESVDVTVTVALKDTVKNYTLKEATVITDAVIAKADAPALTAPSVQTLLSNSVVTGSKDYSFSLASIISGIPADAGTVTYTVKSEGTYAKKIDTGIDGSTLKLSVAEAQAAATTDSVVITVSSTNYNSADVTVNFEFKNKTTVDVTLSDIEKTYGEAYTVNGVYANQPASGYTWTYKYEGIEGTDYPASDDKPVNAGVYRITAYYEDNTPDGDIPGHIGEATATLIIEKKQLTLKDGTLVVTKVYDGEKTFMNAPQGALEVIGFIGEDEVFVDMSACVVGESSSADVGTHTVEISGLRLGGADKDNYTIPDKYTFKKATITKQLQSALTINGSDANLSAVYGDADVEIVVGGGNGDGAYNLVSSDSSIVKLTAMDSTTWTAKILKAGTVTLTASKKADSNYEAAEDLVISLVIEPKAIADTDFVFDLENKVFTGSEIKPAVSSEKLKATTDYEVAYANNTNVGTATITITGKGNYKGEIVKEFTITAKEFNETDFAVTGLAEGYTYTGEAIAPLVNVKWGNILLVAGTDYDAVYANNIEAGTANVTLTGKENYSGTIEKTFTINPAPYTGSVTITADVAPIAEGTVLTADAPAGDVLSYQWKRNGEAIEGATEISYTVTAEDEAAEISVEVTSEGNYTGTLESASVVVGKSVVTGTVEITTVETELSVTVTTELSEEDYEIVWLRNGVVIEGATGTTYTPTKEDKGSEITVKIVAKGESYTGEILSNAMPIPAEAPSFEKAPTVSAGNGSLTVSFEAFDNGAEITNYQILVDGEVVANLDGNQTSYTVTGLVNGTEYAIKVIAINAEGSTESEEVKATPYGGGGSSGGGGGSFSGYTVKFITNGGSAVNSVKVEKNGTLARPETPSKPGYKFEGWYTDAELTTAYDFTQKVVSNITLYAKWSATDEEPVADGFADVNSSAYYADAVKWAVDNSITNGTSANRFSPDAECTRAQMVTFLWRAAGSPTAQNTDSKFTDIQPGSYYYDAVMWAVEKGITSGVSETSFSPDSTVSRAQTVTFLWRLANSPAVEGSANFADVQPGDYYADAVKWAVDANVTNGLTATSFGPQAACTRAQIVTFMYRYFVK